MKKILILILLYLVACSAPNPEKEVRGLEGIINGDCGNLESLTIQKIGKIDFDCEEKVYWIDQVNKFTEGNLFTMIIRTKDGQEVKQQLKGTVGVNFQSGGLGPITIPNKIKEPKQDRKVVFCVPTKMGVIPYSEINQIEQKINGKWVIVEKNKADINSLQMNVLEEKNLLEVRLTIGKSRDNFKNVSIDLGGGCEQTGEGIYYYVPNGGRGICFDAYGEYAKHIEGLKKETTSPLGYNEKPQNAEKKNETEAPLPTNKRTSSNCEKLKKDLGKLEIKLIQIPVEMGEKSQNPNEAFDTKKANRLAQLTLDSINTADKVDKIQKQLKRMGCN